MMETSSRRIPGPIYRGKYTPYLIMVSHSVFLNKPIIGSSLGSAMLHHDLFASITPLSRAFLYAVSRPMQNSVQYVSQDLNLWQFTLYFSCHHFVFTVKIAPFLIINLSLRCMGLASSFPLCTSTSLLKIELNDCMFFCFCCKLSLLYNSSTSC